MKRITQQSGFTLLEVLLYLGLSFIMVAVLGNIGVDVLKSKNRGIVREQLFYETSQVSLQLEEAMRQAEHILIPASGASSTSLVLSYENGGTVSFFESDGRLVMVREGEEEVNLMGSRTTLGELMFTNASTEEREAVRVMLTLDDISTGGGEGGASSTVHTTMRVHY